MEEPRQDITAEAVSAEHRNARWRVDPEQVETTLDAWKHRVGRSGNQHLNREAVRRVLDVAVDVVRIRCERVDEWPQMPPAIDVDEMQSRRWRERQRACLLYRVVRRGKPRQQHEHVQRSEYPGDQSRAPHTRILGSTA